MAHLQDSLRRVRMQSRSNNVITGKKRGPRDPRTPKALFLLSGRRNRVVNRCTRNDFNARSITRDHGNT